MSNVFAVIMAGGAGARFWPLSRQSHPKQLLPLVDGSESLLSATARRVGRVAPPSHTLVVTSALLAPAVARELPLIDQANILGEPAARNTAPCVGWAALHVRRRDPQGVMVVLPADHHIADDDAFVAVASAAIAMAEQGMLVTVGVRPTRAETGYGYIELGEPLADGIYRARRFVEKPNRQRAEQFLASGTFLWNSGMFFFRADAILEQIRLHLPALASALDEYDAAMEQGGEPAAVEKTYGQLPTVSIDHGIMEKAQSVAVIPASFGWCDLGSWTTAWELAEKDSASNALPADAIAVDSSGCYVRAPHGKLVALVGVHDLVVIDTQAALLIVPRDRAQDTKKVVEILKTRDDKEHL